MVSLLSRHRYSSVNFELLGLLLILLLGTTYALAASGGKEEGDAKLRAPIVPLSEVPDNPTNKISKDFAFPSLDKSARKLKEIWTRWACATPFYPFDANSYDCDSQVALPLPKTPGFIPSATATNDSSELSKSEKNDLIRKDGWCVGKCKTQNSVTTLGKKAQNFPSLREENSILSSIRLKAASLSDANSSGEPPRSTTLHSGSPGPLDFLVRVEPVPTLPTDAVFDEMNTINNQIKLLRNDNNAQSLLAIAGLPEPGVSFVTQDIPRKELPVLEKVPKIPSLFSGLVNGSNIQSDKFFSEMFMLPSSNTVVSLSDEIKKKSNSPLLPSAVSTGGNFYIVNPFFVSGTSDSKIKLQDTSESSNSGKAFENKSNTSLQPNTPFQPVSNFFPPLTNTFTSLPGDFRTDSSNGFFPFPSLSAPPRATSGNPAINSEKSTLFNRKSIWGLPSPSRAIFSNKYRRPLLNFPLLSSRRKAEAPSYYSSTPPTAFTTSYPSSNALLAPLSSSVQISPSTSSATAYNLPQIVQPSTIHRDSTGNIVSASEQQNTQPTNLKSLLSNLFSGSLFRKIGRPIRRATTASSKNCCSYS